MSLVPTPCPKCGRYHSCPPTEPSPELLAEAEAYWRASLPDPATLGVPRRACLDRMTPAERAISDAIQAVEAIGADPLLTDAVVLLGQAKSKVADYVDREPPNGPSGRP